ncbi:MAG TPA: hypothetical protein VFH37_00170 [Candidatus Saccharimonadales bacterium]|nr:hypothetical protein [Candidatus Saccharimonadales bacterium]
MDSRTEKFPKLASTHEKTRRRNSQLSAGKQALAGAGVALALIGIGYAQRPPKNPEKAKLKAALIKKEIKTSQPGIVVEPYTVDSTYVGQLLSGVAANLHPMLSESTNAMDEITALESYQTAIEKGTGTFTAGDHLNIAIDTNNGTILPKSAVPDSATWQR